MSIRYSVLRPASLDQALVEKWRAIQQGVPAFDSPYFCPEFTLLAGQVRDNSRVTVIEDGGEVVGFFPHERTLIGGGRPVGGPFSDFHGVLSGPDATWAATDLVRASALRAWDFDHLVSSGTQFEPYVQAHAISPRIHLHAGYEAYVKERRAAGSDYISKTEGLGRKLSREFGALEFTLHDTREDVLPQLFRWKSDQYKSSGLPDAFSVIWTRDLLGRIAATASEPFAGVCSSLRLDGRLLAVHMGMRSRGVLHYWFPAYEPAFSKFSVGILLLLRVAESISKISVHTIDLGKGEAQYKLRLMNAFQSISEGAVVASVLTSACRRLREFGEKQELRGGVGAICRYPMGAFRKIERWRRYR